MGIKYAVIAFIILIHQTECKNEVVPAGQDRMMYNLTPHTV